jgi:hypothetical protein
MIYLFLSFWGHNFLISNSFSMIITLSNAPRGGVQFVFGHQKQRSSPLDSGLPWALKCSVTGRSTPGEIFSCLLLFLQCLHISELPTSNPIKPSLGYSLQSYKFDYQAWEVLHVIFAMWMQELHKAHAKMKLCLIVNII